MIIDKTLGSIHTFNAS